MSSVIGRLEYVAAIAEIDRRWCELRVRAVSERTSKLAGIDPPLCPVSNRDAVCTMSMLRGAASRAVAGPSKLLTGTARVPAVQLLAGGQTQATASFRQSHQEASWQQGQRRSLSLSTRGVHVKQCPCSVHVNERRREEAGTIWRRAASSTSTSTTQERATTSVPSATTHKESATVQTLPKEADVVPEDPKSAKKRLGELRRLASLARPERNTIATAIGLVSCSTASHTHYLTPGPRKLFVSSSVSLSIPLTIGKIIDVFSATSTSSLPVSAPTAAAILALFFAIGASANVGRVA